MESFFSIFDVRGRSTSIDAMYLAASERDQSPWEHSDIFCGTDERTDCPLCIIKFWPLRRQDDIAEKLEALGIDYQYLADMLIQPISPRLEKLITSVVDTSLRQQQRAMLNALFANADRDHLRFLLRELMFDDIAEIADAVYTQRNCRGKRLRKKVG